MLQCCTVHAGTVVDILVQSLDKDNFSLLGFKKLNGLKNIYIKKLIMVFVIRLQLHCHDKNQKYKFHQILWIKMLKFIWQ